MKKSQLPAWGFINRVGMLFPLDLVRRRVEG